jgi:hypothetical protein
LFVILYFIGIFQVDVTANPSLGKRFGVKGFPTLLLISKGMVYRYPGGKDWPRNREKLLKFATGGLFREVATDVEPCPPPPDLVAELKKAAQQTTDAFLFYVKDPAAIQDHEWGFLLAGFTAGILFSSILLVFVRMMFGSSPNDEASAISGEIKKNV